MALVRGKPLVCHAVEAALAAGFRTVVLSNDPTVRGVVEAHFGEAVELWERPAELESDEASIDDVVGWLAEPSGEFGPGLSPFMVLQPTLLMDGLGFVLEKAARLGAGGGPFTVTAPVRKLLWRQGNLLGVRSQRQQLVPEVSVEVGLRVVPDGLGPWRPLWMELTGWVDVDSPDDLVALNRRSGVVLFSPVASPVLGWGHVARCEALARQLQHHDVRFDQSAMAGVSVDWPGLDGVPDVVVLDRLDSTRELVAGWQAVGATVVSFEDQGEGAELADLVVSDMYRSGRASRRELVGPEWAVLRPEFVGLPDPVVRRVGRRVLVTFGGADPAGLTDKVRGWWPDGLEVRVVEPPARSGVHVEGMAGLMRWADLVVTSGGRTLYEAAACGTPALAVLANEREGRHIHLGVGNVVVGMGWDVPGGEVVYRAQRVLDEYDWRVELSATGRRAVDGRGVERLGRVIDGLIADRTEVKRG